MKHKEDNNALARRRPNVGRIGQRLFAERDTGNKLRTKRVAHKDNQIRGPNFHTSKLIISSSITGFRLSVESSWRHYDVIPLSDGVRA